MDAYELTRAEKRGNHYFKRDDEFVINGVCGGKARVAYTVINDNINTIKEVVTCGSRDSRQCEIIAKVCEHFGLKCHLFMPSGKETDITESISGVNGAEIHRTKVGYNNVLVAQSKAYASDNGFYYIPFGMEFMFTIAVNMHQVRNIPENVKRVIVPCGGGMNMVSIIRGLEYYKRYDVEVVGVVVGKKPNTVFKSFVEPNLFNELNVKYSFVEYPSDYHIKAKETEIDGLTLDPVYEAKCIPFINDGDLMWIVGKKM